MTATLAQVTHRAMHMVSLLETPTDPVSDMTTSMKRIMIESTFDPSNETMCMALCVTCARVAVIIMPRGYRIMVDTHTVTNGNLIPITCRSCPQHVNTKVVAIGINRLFIENFPEALALATWLGVRPRMISNKSVSPALSHYAIGEKVEHGCTVLGLYVDGTVDGETHMPKPMFTFAPAGFI